MKDFNDYLKHLSNSIESGQLPMPEIRKMYMLTDTTLENVSAFMENYANDVLRAAGILSIQYLRAYHEWLQAQTE